MHEYSLNPIHFAWSAAVIVLIPIIYGSGLSITKYGSAAQRTTIECARNALIWFFFLVIVPIEKFTWLQFWGFVVLIFGVLLYNEILVLPIFKFNYYTKLAIERRQEMKQ